MSIVKNLEVCYKQLIISSLSALDVESVNHELVNDSVDRTLVINN